MSQDSIGSLFQKPIELSLDDIELSKTLHNYYNNVYKPRYNNEETSSFFSICVSEEDNPDNIDGIETLNLDSELGLAQITSSGVSVDNKISFASTDNVDISKANAVFDEMLTKHTAKFIWKLNLTDFEDGIDNWATKAVESYLDQNKYVTMTWLNSLFSTNQKNQSILASLLRIVSATIDVSDSNKLLPMVIAGLNEPSSMTQEAALMVIEKWRTKECLDALDNLVHPSPWIRSYASSVQSELYNELHNGH